MNNSLGVIELSSVNIVIFAHLSYVNTGIASDYPYWISGRAIYPV